MPEERIHDLAGHPSGEPTRSEQPTDAAWVRECCKRFPGVLETMPTPFDIAQLKVRANAILDVASYLKAEGFRLLLDVGGVDYLPRQPRFEVVYLFLDVTTNRRLRLRLPLVDGESVPSLAEIYPNAAAAEREVYDLFGVIFSNHPRLERILMPENWQGHPLRKDYPLRGEREADRIQMPNPGRGR